MADRVMLTARETQIAVMVGLGLRWKQIETELGITHQTIARHLRNAVGKTGAKNTMHLAVMVAVHRDRMKRAAESAAAATQAG